VTTPDNEASAVHARFVQWLAHSIPVVPQAAAMELDEAE
jgi:hypothetical protein